MDITIIYRMEIIYHLLILPTLLTFINFCMAILYHLLILTTLLTFIKVCMAILYHLLELCLSSVHLAGGIL